MPTSARRRVDLVHRLACSWETGARFTDWPRADRLAVSVPTLDHHEHCQRHLPAPLCFVEGGLGDALCVAGSDGGQRLRYCRSGSGLHDRQRRPPSPRRR